MPLFMMSCRQWRSGEPRPPQVYIGSLPIEADNLDVAKARYQVMLDQHRDRYSVEDFDVSEIPPPPPPPRWVFVDEMFERPKKELYEAFAKHGPPTLEARVKFSEIFRHPLSAWLGFDAKGRYTGEIVRDPDMPIVDENVVRLPPGLTVEIEDMGRISGWLTRSVPVERLSPTSA